MIDTLDFGKYIYSKLKDLTDNRVYPLVADNNVEIPFIVYQRIGLSTEYTKDGLLQDSVRMRISAVCDTYAQSLKLAKEIRNRLVQETVEFDEMVIDEARIISAIEEYNNSYIQTMEFEFTVNNL